MTTLYSLTPERTYYIHVQARNSMGHSPMSQLVTVITRPGIPGQPTGLTATSLDSKRVMLSWEKPLHSFNIIGYMIQVNSSTGNRRELRLTSPIEKHIIDGLEPDTEFSFRVAAQTARGLGAYCEEVTVRTHQSVPTGPPNAISAVALSSRQLQINWEPPPVDKRNGIITEYIIRWRTVSSRPNDSRPSDDISDDEYTEALDTSDKAHISAERKWHEAKIPSGNIAFFTIDGLKPFTFYEITVAAGTQKGFGPPSQAITLMTDGDGKYYRLL
ncbi:hypothetical protein AB6A40_008090 [Gnathostoma spinigerum]|uniref:Fibronectin type-III domain-containing protein n=1 Tax=Gnathostoma spinigerum TaxID=75299 RepID=A0ABD6ENK1_9BILA